MGFGVTELLIILAIVLVLFGDKKLRNIGGDVGGAIKNFKNEMKAEEATEKKTNEAINKNDSIDAVADVSDESSNVESSTVS